MARHKQLTGNNGHRQERGGFIGLMASLVRLAGIVFMIMTLVSGMLTAIALFFGFRKIQRAITGEPPNGKKLPAGKESPSRMTVETEAVSQS